MIGARSILAVLLLAGYYYTFVWQRCNAILLPDLAKLTGGSLGYGTVARMLRDGDLVVIAGRSLDSSIVRGVSGSCWSHVGIVLIADDNSPLLLHCDLRHLVPDDISGSFRPGVQLAHLGRYLQTRRHDLVVWRPLFGPALDRATLRRCVDEHHGRGYQTNPLALLPCTLGLRDLDDGGGAGPTRDGSDRSSATFCSALVAAVYGTCGVLEGKYRSTEYHPRCFGPDAVAPFVPPFDARYSLGPAIEIRGR